MDKEAKRKSRAKRARRVKDYERAMAAVAAGSADAKAFLRTHAMPAKVRAKIKKTTRALPAIRSSSFYRTEEWKQLRYAALVASDGKCLCCGASAKDGAVLRVDHVESIRMAPHRKADPTNLQVLCNSCNWGKGGLDATDWRPSAPPAPVV